MSDVAMINAETPMVIPAIETMVIKFKNLYLFLEKAYLFAIK